MCKRKMCQNMDKRCAYNTSIHTQVVILPSISTPMHVQYMYMVIAAVKVCSSPVGHKKVGMRGLGDMVRLSSFFIMTGPLD